MTAASESSPGVLVSPPDGASPRLAELAATQARLQAELQERKAAQESLRQTQAVLEKALSAANVSLWSWNLKSNETWVSPSYWTWLGYQPGELTTSFDLWLSMVHPDDRQRMLAHTERYVADPWPDFRSEFRLRRRDGSYCWLMSVGGVVERDEQGRAVHMTGCHLDITELRQLEERARIREAELAHAARLHTLGELVTGLADQLEQPLQGVAEEADRCRAALAEGKAVPLAAEGLRRIATSAHAAADIIRRLRRLVRKEAAERAEIDLTQTLGDAAELIAFQTRHDGIDLELQVPGDLATVPGDAVQIEQVALNLLRNAVEAVRQMPKGRRTIRIVVRPSADFVVVDVIDSGPGIDPADCHRVFDAFFSRKREGLGMGLAVSRTIVEAHGGQLSCEQCRPGEATFRFTLPRAEPTFVRLSGGSPKSR